MRRDSIIKRLLESGKKNYWYFVKVHIIVHIITSDFFFLNNVSN